MEIAENQRPIFGTDLLHGIHTNNAIKDLAIRYFLQPARFISDIGKFLFRACEHILGLINPNNGLPLFQEGRLIPTGSTGCVKDSAFRVEMAQEFLNEQLVSGVAVQAIFLPIERSIIIILCFTITL